MKMKKESVRSNAFKKRNALLSFPVPLTLLMLSASP